MHQDYQRWVPQFLPEEVGHTQLIHRHVLTIDGHACGAHKSFAEGDDTEPRKIEITDKAYYDCFQPLRIKNNARLCVTMQSVQNGDYHPAFAYSDDFGESWSIVDLKSTPKYEPVYPSVAPRWENNGAEPVVTELPDGKLMLIARTALDYFYVYYSDDYGESWTDGEQSGFHGTLTTPFLLRMTDGRLLFF